MHKLNPSFNQAEKGNALDRVFHKFYQSRNTVSRDRYVTGLLTQEVVIPNTTVIENTENKEKRLESIIHLKWGNNGKECFMYLAKNTRVARLYDKPLVFYTVTEKHLEGLTKVSKEISGEAGVAVLGLLKELGDAELDGKTIRDHIRIIETYAEAGKDELLKGYYQDVFITQNEVDQENKVRENLDWKSFCDSLLINENYNELMNILNLHAKIHSSYYEDEYHLKFARALSYLLSKKKDDNDSTKKLIENAINQYYPILNKYPNAWRTIDSYLDQDSNNRAIEEDDSEDSKEEKFLREFNLQEYLGQNIDQRDTETEEIGESRQLTEKEKILDAFRDYQNDLDIIDLLKNTDYKYNKLEVQHKNEIFDRLCDELLKRIKVSYQNQKFDISEELEAYCSSNVIDYSQAYPLLVKVLTNNQTREISISKTKKYQPLKLLGEVNDLKPS